MKKSLLLNIIAALFVTSIAQAGTIYIGAGIYASDTDAVIEGVENFDLDDDDTAQALFLGYKFSNGIAVETGYYDLGKYSEQVGGSSGFVDADALSASIVARINIIPIVTVYGKAGYAYVENKIEFESELIDILQDNSSTDALYGLGVDVNLGDRISLYAEYVRFDADLEVDLLGAGIRINF